MRTTIIFLMLPVTIRLPPSVSNKLKLCMNDWVLCYNHFTFVTHSLSHHNHHHKQSQKPKSPINLTTTTTLAAFTHSAEHYHHHACPGPVYLNALLFDLPAFVDHVDYMDWILIVRWDKFRHKSALLFLPSTTTPANIRVVWVAHTTKMGNDDILSNTLNTIYSLTVDCWSKHKDIL